MQNLLQYSNDLIRAGYHFAAVCVLDRAADTAIKAHLMCVCALALKDNELLCKYVQQCTSAPLKSLCARVADREAHLRMAREMQDAVAHAAPLVETLRPPIGVLIPAGGARLLTQLIANLTSLRNTGSTLPVTVVHACELSAQEEHDLSSQFDVKIVDVTLLMPAGEWRGFQIKLAALAISQYQITILADADILWVRDPSCIVREMQDAPGARMLLFSDFWHFHEKPHNRTAATAWLYDYYGLVATGNEVESGVVVTEVNSALRAAMRFFALNYKYYFGITFGDKDLFRIAAAAAGLPVLQMPVPRLLCFEEESYDHLVGHSMLHTNMEGEWSHIHCTLHPMTPHRAQEVPYPTKMCDGDHVQFIVHNRSETVGCKPRHASGSRADVLVLRTLFGAAQAAVTQALSTFTWLSSSNSESSSYIQASLTE